MRLSRLVLTVVAVLGTAQIAVAAEPPLFASDAAVLDASNLMLPRPETKGVSARATPGEFEPIGFQLRARRPLHRIHLTLRPLESALGKIPVSALTLRRVVSGRRPSASPDSRAPVAPQWLVPHDAPVDLAPDHAAVYCLTVNVPHDAAAGVYRGAVDAISDGQSVLSIPVTVEVRPFSLAPPSAAFAMLFTYEFRNLERFEPFASQRLPAAGREAFVNRGRAVVRDMAEHGMTAIFPHSGFRVERNGGQVALPDLEASLHSAAEFGMRGVPGFYVGLLVNAPYRQIPRFDVRRDTERLKEIASRAAAVARAAGFPRIAVLPSDEPNDPDDRKLPVARHLLEALRGLPDVRVAVTSGTARFEPIRKLAPLHQLSIVAADAPASLLRELKESGHEVWVYENESTTGQNPSWSRFVFGFWGWRAGVDAVSAWTYPSHMFAPHDDRPRVDGDNRPVPEFDGQGRPINTLVWEGIREGVDDRRYVDTLIAMIRRARARGLDTDAADAQQVLADLQGSISPEASRYLKQRNANGDPAPLQASPAFLDAARERIAAKIVRLLDLLRN